MSFCIMRMDKIKDWYTIGKAVGHNSRERPPPNADPERSHLNRLSLMDSGMTYEKLEKMLPEKNRKNAVLLVEVMMTTSPGWTGNHEQYLQACKLWAKNVFGGFDNLIRADIHNDENTPHVHILFAPIKDGKLNSKHFIGGHRDRMRELQDDFYENVGKKFGLDRGNPREETRARHSRPTLKYEAEKLDNREGVLAGREAKLDEREKAISEREVKIAKAADEFKRIMGTTPAEIGKLKTMIANWDKATPTALRVIAKDIEQSGAATVGDYRKAREAIREKKQKQEIGFSR